MKTLADDNKTMKNYPACKDLYKTGFEVLVLLYCREFSSKEVAMYNNLHGVQPVFIPTLTTKVSHRFR